MLARNLNSKEAMPKLSNATEDVFKAARMGDLETLKTTLADRATLAREEGGLTPLMVAALYGHANCVDHLIRSSDFEARDDQGNTALMHAMFSSAPGNASCIELLLNAGGANAQNFEGESALSLAAKHSSPELFRAVLAASDPSQQFEHGNTIVHVAVDPYAGNSLPAGQQ